jgi:putative ABC transport system permease protein
VPGKINNFMGSAIKGKNKSLSIIYADTSFLQTLNIKQVKGRELLPSDIGNVCMLNEAAYKYFEWTDLENRRYNNGKEGGFEVIGVVKDFHYASMHQPIEPMCILFRDVGWHTNISIRIAKGAIGPSMDYIQKVWKEIIPDYPLQYQFYDEWFDGMYRKEEKLAKTIGLFALLAIGISCMGIFGLAIFSAERRTKEIGIRKVSGAQTAELMIMLNKDFIRWVAVAFVVACPMAWYAMNRWLVNFAYRTEISWWVFALSGLAALVIALLTVSWQTWRAATRNPVEALRYE